MKPAFMLNTEGHVVSTLVPSSERATAFQQGTQVTLRSAPDLSPYGRLSAGTKMLVAVVGRTLERWS